MALGRPHRMANSKVQVRLQRTGAAQPVDPTFKTKLAPRNAQFAATIELEGQPRFEKEERVNAGETGDKSWTDGYITFARRDLARKGIPNPQVLNHALLTGFERDNGGVVMVATQYQVVEVRDRGHLAGGPILVKVFFRIYKDARGSV
jgi:hypothetical protein